MNVGEYSIPRKSKENGHRNRNRPPRPFPKNMRRNSHAARTLVAPATTIPVTWPTEKMAELGRRPLSRIVISAAAIHVKAKMPYTGYMRATVDGYPL
jgi:hypothetical protein